MFYHIIFVAGYDFLLLLWSIRLWNKFSQRFFSQIFYQNFKYKNMYTLHDENENKHSNFIQLKCEIKERI